jgi:hypothetical protein
LGSKFTPSSTLKIYPKIGKSYADKLGAVQLTLIEVLVVPILIGYPGDGGTGPKAI